MTLLQENYKDVAFIDYILRVTAIFTNMCDSIVDGS